MKIVYQALYFLTIIRKLNKGELISKVNCQAVVDSPKKGANAFAFFDLKSCYLVKSNAVFRFFGESNFS